MSDLAYEVNFRGFPACPCLARWLPVLERELIARGVIRQSIDIAQLIGDYEKSGGTHSTGGVFDIWQHDPTTVWVCRQMGADASWARTTGSFANSRHTHGVLTGCPHNGPARYQIDEVRAGGDGLIGSAPDSGPRPLSGRTWREGIAWANQQKQERDRKEDDMPNYREWPEADRKALASDVADAVFARTVAFTTGKGAKKTVSIRQALARILGGTVVIRKEVEETSADVDALAEKIDGMNS